MKDGQACRRETLVHHDRAVPQEEDRLVWVRSHEEEEDRRLVWGVRSHAAARRGIRGEGVGRGRGGGAYSYEEEDLLGTQAAGDRGSTPEAGTSWAVTVQAVHHRHRHRHRQTISIPCAAMIHCHRREEEDRQDRRPLALPSPAEVVPYYMPHRRTDRAAPFGHSEAGRGICAADVPPVRRDQRHRIRHQDRPREDRTPRTPFAAACDEEVVVRRRTEEDLVGIPAPGLVRRDTQDQVVASLQLLLLHHRHFHFHRYCRRRCCPDRSQPCDAWRRPAVATLIQISMTL